jgi:TctA family transporter
MAVCLVGAVALTSEDLTKALCMIITGILLGLVGSDVNSGALRFTFGLSELWDGIDFVALAVGLFALADIIANLEDPEQRQSIGARLTTLWPTADDWRRMWAPMIRGTAVGGVMGILPGAGASVASFLTYSLEKRVSRRPEMFGKGAIEGVAGPEAANNAAAQTAFIPTLALGIPGGASMALFLGALTLHNIQPGPRVISDNPELFWGLVASMWIGNAMLVILNLPLVGLWAQILRVPYKALFPSILMFCCIGVYSVQNSAFSVLLLCALGAMGYVFNKLRCEPAPLALGFVLGPMLEEHFRRALAISHGDFSIFVTRPVSAAFLVLAVLLLGVLSIAALRSRAKPT